MEIDTHKNFYGGRKGWLDLANWIQQAVIIIYSF